MGITVKTNTKAKASLKLYNHISSYLFEQEYDELRNNPQVKLALIDAKHTLAKLIKEYKNG